jgi:hypothetical protein
MGDEMKYIIDVPDDMKSALLTGQTNSGYWSQSIEFAELEKAEPEIIYCKDCRMRNEIDKEIDIWRPCRAIATPDNFSCIRAESANREVAE